MNRHDDDGPERSALREMDFPGPDPQRDRRVGEAIDHALAARRRAHRSPVGRRPWRAAAAVLALLVPLAAALWALAEAHERGLKGWLSELAAVFDDDAGVLRSPDGPPTPVVPKPLPAPTAAAQRAALAAHRLPQGGPPVSDEERMRFASLGRRLDARSAPVWQSSGLAPHRVRVRVGARDDLPLEGLQLQVRIDGFRARVVVDVLVRNDRARALSGVFQLRLPTGASPFLLATGESVRVAGAAGPPAVAAEATAALDADAILARRGAGWRRPQVARMASRRPAPRRPTPARADRGGPGWAGAGVFSAPLAALRAGALQRIVLGYDVDLLRVGDDLIYTLELPARRPRCVVDLDVAASPDVDVRWPGAVAARRVDGRLRARLVDPAARSLTVELRGGAGELLVGDDPSGSYFAARLAPTLPTGSARAASRAVLLLDTSLSASPQRFGIWLRLARALLERNRDTLREFAVLTFDVEPRWWRAGWTANTAEAVESLLTDARALALEGATDLGAALAAAGRPSWDAGPGGWDLFLLGDGVPSWGRRDAAGLVAQLEAGRAGALFAYHTGLAGEDGALLDRLATATGGARFGVVGADQIASAATAHRQRPWRLERIEVDGGHDLLLAGRPRVLFPGQLLTLVGRGAPGPQAALRLSLRRGGASHSVRWRPRRRRVSPLAPRIYGQVATGQLERWGELGGDLGAAYGRYFAVAGATRALQLHAPAAADPAGDLARVRREPVDPAVRRVSARAERAVGPKARFLAWLVGLERLELGLVLPAAIREAVRAAPPAAFEVRARPLGTVIRRWRDLPGPLAEQLARGVPEAADVDAEVERRLASSAGEALKALSSRVEAGAGDLASVLGAAHSALAWGLPGHAVGLYRRVAGERPTSPHGLWGMARSLAADHPVPALACYELALAGRWDGRFGDVKTAVGRETLRLLRRVGRGHATSSPLGAWVRRRAQALARRFGDPAALEVTLVWSREDADLDLRVSGPGGHAVRGAPAEASGGRLSADVRRGLGPELYTIREAPPGRYRVRVGYPRALELRASGRTRALVTLVRRGGTADESLTYRLVALERGRPQRLVAALELGR